VNLDELCSAAQADIERRRWPSPGGRVNTTLNGRTVRYYTTSGLMDRPSGYDGGVARYGPRHLLQLLAIKALQAQFLPLPEIQRRLYGRSDTELQSVVDAMAAAPVPEIGLQTWLTINPVPGLRLVLEDRDEFLDWLRRHSEADLYRNVEHALHLLAQTHAKEQTP
jgi:DNA-binding transcriptional MerR regulator